MKTAFSLTRHLSLVLTLAVASAAAAPARAETLEVAFWNRAATLIKHFRDNGHKTVGVLKFHFQKGVDGKLTHTAGSLNANAARRLETALVLELAKGNNSGNKEIMIVRDASATAAAIPNADHLGYGWQRERLFAPIYTPSWGTKKFVFPDTFVTGKLVLHDTLAKMTVQLQIFDQKNNTLRPLNEFDVDVRTDTLIETGHNLRSIDPDKLAAQAPKNVATTPVDTAKPSVTTPVDNTVPATTQAPPVNPNLPAAITGGGTAVQPVGTTTAVTVAPQEDVLKAAPVELQIFYDNKPVALNFVNGEYLVEAPKPGQKVLFGMVRRDNAVDAKYGVVLQLNGMCTLGMERKPPAECQRWVFEKNDPAGFVGGFFNGNKEVASFTVVPPSKELQTEYKENLGTISYTIFKEGPAAPTPNPSVPLKDQVAEAKITKLIAQGANVQPVAGEPVQPAANSANPVVAKKEPETKPEAKSVEVVANDNQFPGDLPLRSLSLLRARLEDLAAQPLRNVALRNAIIPGAVQTIDPLRTTSFVNPGVQMSVTIRYFKGN